jgi:hypothetical protein
MAPNCGRHTTGPIDPMERHQGSRVPSTGTPTGQGKGIGASPTPVSVERPKAMMVEAWVQGLGDVALATTTIVAAVAWAGDGVLQSQDQIVEQC